MLTVRSHAEYVVPEGTWVRNAYISGTGYHLPERVVTNDDLAREYGIDTSDEWIRQRTGVGERRFADVGQSTSDLAVPAVRMALDDAGLANRDVDLIVFCTLSPDYHFPGSGVFLQQKLGMCDEGHFPGTLDVRNQCSAFIYGLGTAVSMVRSGALDNIVVVGAEVHSAAIDLTSRGRGVSSLFGDGAGALVVSATDEDHGVRTWHVGADGRYGQVLCQKIWDISRRPYIPLDEEGRGVVDPEMMWAQMDGGLVFKHAVQRMIEVMNQSLEAEGLALDDIDVFAFHQANLKIIEYIRKVTGIPASKCLTNIERYGNTTAATIPLLLAEAARDGRVERGSKVCCVAFGSGFTWGSAVIDW